jgi:hypothetical protein
MISVVSECFCFCLPILKEQLPKTAIAPNVLRVYEPVARARRLRSCSSAAAVTERRVAEGTFADTPKAGWRGACLLISIQASAVTEANVP